MGTFRHTRDGNIVINETLVVPLSWFVTEEPAYALPVGYVEQDYDSAGDRVLKTATSETRTAAPWATGDGYIANIAAYTANYATFVATPASLAAAKIAQKTLAEAEADTYLIGNVRYSGTNYPSSQRDRLANELYYFVRFSNYDPTHYIYDSAGNQVNLELYQMKEILDIMDKLHFLVKQNLDTHKDAIDALGTIGAVTGYDYTVGYPTLPYTG